MSRSGYYAWKQSAARREAKETADAVIITAIETHLKKHIGTYGYRQMSMRLLEYGYIVNHKRMARIMKAYGMQGHIRTANPYKQITKKTQEHRTCPNLLNRNFDQKEPERVGGTDITYVWVSQLKCFVYLSVVKDFCTGEILAHVVSRSLTIPIVLQTIDILAERLGDKVYKFMLHSDQGVHYTHPHYQTRLKKLKLVQSMSRKGNCIDNAATETFFGHMKDELDLKECTSVHDVQIAVAAYISYYNQTRGQWHRKKMAPIDYRDHLFATNTT